MNLFSTPAKEAIKTGLALAMTYAISLPLGWENPKWAAFTVAMISLPGIGQSLNKGARRMAGTLMGGVVALTLLGLFPQDRWGLVCGLSLYLGVCVYMLTGRRNQYFWHVSAFIPMVIVAQAGASPLQDFQLVMTRVEETATGILIYTLVSVFIWPRNSMGEFRETSGKLFATQGRLFQAYRAMLGGQGPVEEAQPLRMQEAALLPRLAQTLEAAQSDSHEVFALRHQWQRFHHLSKTLGETLERWRGSFPGVQALDCTALLPNLEPFLAELDLRFEEIQRLLGGETPVRPPQPMTLAIDRVKIQALSNFQRAAVVVTRTELERLGSLTHALCDCVRDIRGYEQPASHPQEELTRHKGPTVDPDRFMAAVRTMVHLWIAFIIWVYVDNLPGHATFVDISTTLVLATYLTGASGRTMLLPFALGSVCAGVVYVFVMPHLSGYLQLAVLTFGWTFVVYYWFAKPSQGLMRVGAMVPFMYFAAIENQQTYSFADYANSTTMIMLAISLIIATEYLFGSPRPEKVFLRLLGRFFRHSEFLVSHLASDWGKKQRLAGLWKTAYYHNDILELPEKLAKWEKQIDYRTFPNNTPEQVQTLVTSLQALAFRIKALVDAREYQQAEPLLRLLHDDLRDWRIRVENLFHRWSENPTDMPEGDLQERLARRLASMEERIKETVDLAAQGDLDEEDYKNFYRLLGSFRSLSESLVGHARLAEQFDFAHWRGARF